MFDVPLDAWYVWLGLTVASSTAVAVAGAMPVAPPPDTDGAAATVDSVAASQYAAVGKHPISNANAVRIGQDSLSLRGPGGTSHATLGYGPVVPVTGDDQLAAVLRGTPPERVFDSRSEYERATERAASREPHWKQTDRLVVRRVSWEGIDVVLVG